MEAGGAWCNATVDATTLDYAFRRDHEPHTRIRTDVSDSSLKATENSSLFRHHDSLHFEDVTETLNLVKALDPSIDPEFGDFGKGPLSALCFNFKRLNEGKEALSVRTQYRHHGCKEGTELPIIAKDPRSSYWQYNKDRNQLKSQQHQEILKMSESNKWWGVGQGEDDSDDEGTSSCAPIDLTSGTNIFTTEVDSRFRGLGLTAFRRRVNVFPAHDQPRMIICMTP